MDRQKIVIAGGSGFLGHSLLKKYADTDVEIVVLTRKAGAAVQTRNESSSFRDGGKMGNVSYVHWDAASPGGWMAELEGSTAVINLVGRSVNCRYTERNKEEIIASRVNATRIIGYAIAKAARPPRVWINAGSAAIFGDGGDEQKDEGSVAGEGFSPEVCKKWEAAFYSIDTPFTRKVVLRMGLVFQKDEGLLKPFSWLVRLGLGGKMGNGEQYISWIHEDDFTGLVAAVIDKDDWQGIINGVSPYPVKNKDFLKALRSAYHIAFGLPQPAFLLRIGASLIGTEAELILSGRRVVSKVLEGEHFAFSYPRLEDALRQLISPLPFLRESEP